MSKLNNNVIKAPIIKNGANGICVIIFIFLCEKSIIVKLATDPIQNDNMTDASAARGPSIQPMPSMSLASPRPIARPRESIQIRANGRANSGPETMLIRDGVTNNGPTLA